MDDGFRRYRVAARTRESSVITSFALVAADGAPLPAAGPGQFLTVRVPDPAGGPALLRHYSLSGDPARRDAYRISVKREPPPPDRPDAPPGRVSTLLHETLAVGSELLARGPEGTFVLDRASERPVLLLAAGVGLTPLLAMAHDLARAGRRAWFVHACEGRDVQAHGAELRGLAAAAPTLRVHVLYRTATADDRVGIDHDGTGLVTRDALQALLPLDDYDVYLCGPTPFMQAVYAILLGLGVREERIRYEFFGKATALRAAAAAAPAVATVPALAAGDGLVVTFAASGRSAVWTGAHDTLLDFAEAQGLAPAFSCRAGICSTCACRLVSGAVDYVTEPLDAPAPGIVLLCSARPREALVLDL